MANGTDEGRPETVKDGERREARGSSGSVSLRSPFTVLFPTSLVPSLHHPSRPEAYVTGEGKGGVRRDGMLMNGPSVTHFASRSSTSLSPRALRSAHSYPIAPQARPRGTNGGTE